MVKPIFCSDEYLVDSSGFVTDLNGNIMKTHRNKKGYTIIALKIDGELKIFGMHVLVARAFCDGYEPGKQANHKDGVKDNNDYTNLEWLTPKENMQHAREVLGYNNRGKNNCWARKIIGLDKKTNNKMYEFDCLMDAGRYFANGDEKAARSKQNSIWRVLSGLRKSYKGCIWKYAEEIT